MFPTSGNYLKFAGTAAGGAFAGIWAHNEHKHLLLTTLAVIVGGVVGYAAGSALDTATGF